MTVSDMERAKLFVLGKTRVGKGELIQTAVRKLTGEVLNIASARMKSHTKCAAGYPVKLNGKPVEFVDTVGYDDSENSDVCEIQFLKMLESTGTAPYYPPLVVLREMAGSDVAWMEKIRSVFPSIVCAFRGGRKAFKEAQKLFANDEFAGIQLFHLHEFQDEEDDSGVSMKIYVQGVMKICEHYTKLVPKREKLNFDSTVFQGKIERVKIRSETKTEERIEGVFVIKEDDVVVKRQKIETVEDGGHFIDKEVRRSSCERWKEGWKTWFLLGAGGWSEKKWVKEWVKDTKQIAVDDSTLEKAKVHYIERSVFRLTFERDIYEVWKVLAGGVKVFMEFSQSGWKEIKKECIEVKHRRAGEIPEML